VLGGVMPERDDVRPVLGVFLNDATGAKLDYYLRGAVAVTSDSCRPDGRVALRVRVTLHSTVPPAGLSPDVTGLHLAGARYTARTNLSIFSPAGGALVSAEQDGVGVAYGAGWERGRAVGIFTVDLAPGGTSTIDALLLTAPAAWTGPTTPTLWVTPAVEQWDKAIGSLPRCTKHV